MNHLENAKLALQLWRKVDPKSVRLLDWRCGTQACFGGHLATWKEFQAQGVFSGKGGTPLIADPEGKLGRKLLSRSVEDAALYARETQLDGYEVAEYLFGDMELFSLRTVHDGPREFISDHEVVVNRLTKHIAHLESAK